MKGFASKIVATAALAIAVGSIACSRTAPYLIIQSLEHYDTCTKLSQPAKVREGQAERYIIRYTSYRIDNPQFTGEGHVGVVAIPGRVDHIIYGTSIGDGRIVATAKDDDGNTLTSSIDVSVVAQDSYPPYVDTCVAGSTPTMSQDASVDASDAGQAGDAGDAAVDGGDAGDASVDAH